MTIKKLALAAVITSTMASAWAFAEDAKPDNQLSYNLGVASDYRYRGISQTHLDPAIQGGADYTYNPTGFYAGVWASSIQWIKDAGGKSNAEVDFYTGFRGNFTTNFSYDAGVLRYQYFSNHLGVNADTTELYGQLGFGPAYVKYSVAATNLFGFSSSVGSSYLDVGANVPLSDKLTLNAHVGRQSVMNNHMYSYNDVKVGFTYDFGFLSASAAVITTDAADGVYPSPKGENLGKAGVVVTLTKTF